MPRAPSFDNHYVLDQAMDVFWRRGYHATSVRHLVEATGLQPGSLYGAFGGKRQLFQQVLDHYHDLNVGQIRELLDSNAPPLERIRGVFDRLLKRCQEDVEGKGCLMANTLLELSCIDIELARRANGMFREIEGEFVRVIAHARDRGEIPAGKDPRALARHLIVSFHGIRVYSRGDMDPSHLRSLVDDALAAFDAHA